MKILLVFFFFFFFFFVFFCFLKESKNFNSPDTDKNLIWNVRKKKDTSRLDLDNQYFAWLLLTLSSVWSSPFYYMAIMNHGWKRDYHNVPLLSIIKLVGFILHSLHLSKMQVTREEKCYARDSQCPERKKKG